MTLQTADVNDLICLIFNQLTDLIESDNYGINCDTEEDLETLETLYSYYKFKCYTRDYVTEYILDHEADLPDYCTRYTHSTGVPR